MVRNPHALPLTADEAHANGDDEAHADRDDTRRRRDSVTRPHDRVHAHDRGLAHDLAVLSRRQMFGLFAGAGLVPMLASCETSTYTGTGADAATTSCSAIPEETAGPYPGDGTNGANALALSGIVRSDIRTSLGGATGVAAGVPVTFAIALVDATTCAPLAGYAIYLWHCDRDGNYSMYSPAIVGESYLRGVQVTDASGQVTFSSIFPGCYDGRWPHVHFEVYPTLASATNGANKLATSQMAMPKATCDVVYATTGYASSATNLGRVSLATDMVFADGATLQIPTITGDVNGFESSLTVAIRV